MRIVVRPRAIAIFHKQSSIWRTCEITESLIGGYVQLHRSIVSKRENFIKKFLGALTLRYAIQLKHIQFKISKTPFLIRAAQNRKISVKIFKIVATVRRKPKPCLDSVLGCVRSDRLNSMWEDFALYVPKIPLKNS